MTSWVITISKALEPHYDFALRDGVWDMPKRFKIRQGDIVYFRVSQGPLRAKTVATADARPLLVTDAVPWKNGRDPYTTRIEFRLLSDQPLVTPSMSTLGERLSKNHPPQIPRNWTDPRDEAILASCFPGRELTPEEALDDEKRAKVWADLSEDLRVRTLQVIALRQGQSAFRKSLLTAYSGACAVTGTATERVLEAAHIAPYKGEHTNRSSNGILLRADIHTLFDLHLVTITPDHVVHVSVDVEDAEYSQYDGRALARLPMTLTDLPDREQLTKHNDECAWLVT